MPKHDGAQAQALSENFPAQAHYFMDRLYSVIDSNANARIDAYHKVLELVEEAV